jgi:hypothetical protein
VETHSFSQLLVNSVTMEIKTTEMVALLLVRLNKTGIAVRLSVNLALVTNFVGMEFQIVIHLKNVMILTLFQMMVVQDA